MIRNRPGVDCPFRFCALTTWGNGEVSARRDDEKELMIIDMYFAQHPIRNENELG